jgi:hypothetical protein
MGMKMKAYENDGAIRYRVCWCGREGSSCVTDAQFNVDLGIFAVSGGDNVDDGSGNNLMASWRNDGDGDDDEDDGAGAGDGDGDDSGGDGDDDVECQKKFHPRSAKLSLRASSLCTFQSLFDFGPPQQLFLRTGRVWVTFDWCQT